MTRVCVVEGKLALYALLGKPTRSTYYTVQLLKTTAENVVAFYEAVFHLLALTELKEAAEEGK